MLTTSILSAIIVLGVLVFAHELGHFIMAKKLRIGVITFSLGFGPRLVRKRIGETDYQIASVPLGGFVKLIGENPDEEIQEEDRYRSFSHAPVWKRAMIVSAGPIFNFFLAIVLFSLVNLFGVPYLPAKIGEMSPGLPAEKSGLKRGDVVLSVNGEKVQKWDDLSRIIRASDGKELTLQVRRDGENLDIRVTPQSSKTKNLFGEEVQIFMIGIQPAEEVVNEKVSPLVAVGMGFEQTGSGIKLTLVSIWKLIERVIPAKTIGGPLMIAQLAGEQAKRGLVSFILFMAILSINLGVINLFPIPILDGGHFIFLGFEAILGKPLSMKKMEIAQQVGLVVIILLMIFAFYNDIVRIVSPGGLKF